MENRWAERLLFLLVSLHVFFWTLIPAVTRTALPLDTLEGLTWGREWQLGYDKNPYLNAWVSQIFSWFGGSSGWSLYLASQLSVALCFWAIWRLGRHLFSPLQAVATAFLLEGIYYITIASPQFNDNVLELALWPMAALFFYQATKDGRLRDWVCVGLTLGLAMVTKYLAVVLIAPMALFMLVNPVARTRILSKEVFVAAAIFMLLVLPHVIWLFDNGFVTITYAFDRAERVFHFTNHFKFAFKFFAEQLGALLPSILLSLWFIKSGKKSKALASFDKQFLGYVAAGPFITLLLLSVIRGYALEPMWGVPFLAPFTLIIVACWQRSLPRSRFMGLCYTVFALFAVLTTAFAVSLIWSPFSSSCKATAYYPGRQVALAAEAAWHAQVDAPLSYVAGPRWEAGNVAFYAKSQPSVYMEWDPRVTTWMDEGKLKEKGAVFVWQIKQGHDPRLSQAIFRRFPGLIVLAPRDFTQGECKTQVGMAILSPAGA